MRHRNHLCGLLGAKLEVLAALDGQLEALLALFALKTQGDLLGRLGLLVEHGLGLAAEPLLLPVVTALAWEPRRREGVTRNHNTRDKQKQQAPHPAQSRTPCRPCTV